jgi:hypothetical protein
MTLRKTLLLVALGLSLTAFPACHTPTKKAIVQYIEPKPVDVWCWTPNGNQTLEITRAISVEEDQFYVTIKSPEGATLTHKKESGESCLTGPTEVQEQANGTTINGGSLRAVKRHGLRLFRATSPHSSSD